MAKSRKNSNARKVEETEKKPFTLPAASVKVEEDEDAWGPDGLTHRQRLFCKYYVSEAHGNATQAARLAGYRNDNYDSLRQLAIKTLRRPNVQRTIQQALAKAFGNAADVRDHIAAIARTSAADFLATGDDGKLHVSLEQMAEMGSLGLIQQIDEEVIEAGGTVRAIKRKIKLYDKLRALELLAKMNGQITEKHQHDVSLRNEDLSSLSPDDLLRLREIRLRMDAAKPGGN